MSKLISTAVDLDRPDPDVFDPIAWFEGTGEDLGLPEGYREQYQADLAIATEKARADWPDDKTG